MKSVSIKEFQTNIYKYITELPLMINRYGKPFFCIVTPEEGLIKQVATFKKPEEKKEVAIHQHIQQNDQKESVATVPENKPLEPTVDPIPDVATSEKDKALDEIINKDLSGIPLKCEAKLPNPCHLDSIGQYKFTVMVQEGEKVLDKYLCGFHLDKLVRDGVEVVKIEL